MIVISVKTSLKEKLGVLCSVDPSATMEEVLFQIQEDLGFPRGMEIKSLVRLLPNGKQMHAVIRKPSYLSDVDYYLARLEDESEEESSDEEIIVEEPPRYSTPVARRTVTAKKVTPASKKKTAKTESPYKRNFVTSKRDKAVASVKRAAAANRRTSSAARREAAAVPAKPRKPRSYQVGKESLTEAQRQQLATVKLDLEKFTEYLTEVEGITKSNINIVVRQVAKLHAGEGIDYKHWRSGVVFKPGYVLRLSDDFASMRDEAVAFEKKNGRDRGNGWLVRYVHTLEAISYCMGAYMLLTIFVDFALYFFSHPVRKVENYQKYLFDNMDKVPTTITTTKRNVITLPSSSYALKAANAAAVSSDKVSGEASESDGDSDAESEAVASRAGLLF
ncbi:MAG: hypothetical protein SGILL_009731 [Bacillariaceae sp.]